jgi:GT2 family glycosyltransferase
MAQIGLVTVLYKSDSVLEGFYESLSLQTFKNYHLYIVDNSPSNETDEILEFLNQKYSISTFTHIKNTNNNGVAKGNNQGIELALKDHCDYVLLLNNDIEFYQPTLLQEMLDEAKTKSEDIIIPKIFYYNSRTIWMAGGHIHNNKAIVSHVGVDEADNDKFNNSGHFDYAPTCFMLISREVFNKVGLMDENYFVYYDDTDFIKRASKAGYKIYYMPNLEIFHKVSSSTGGGETLFSIYYLNRNRIYFIRKNLAFPQRQLSTLYTLATRALLFKYKKAERAKLIQAVVDGYKMEKYNG